MVNHKINIGASRTTSSKGAVDNFPTPPWAVRALFEEVLKPHGLYYEDDICPNALEPCCGAGHMSEVLKEYHPNVASSDLLPYGYGDVMSYQKTKTTPVVITNPPFAIAEDIVLHFLKEHEKMREDDENTLLCILVRAAFFEGKRREEKIFNDHPPTVYCPFTERVSMVKGKLSKKASGNVHYAWFVWAEDRMNPGYDQSVVRIPSCREKYERDEDYIELFSSEVREEQQHD